jgi:site-specific DNA-methyltransferase (adenine-specific)
MKTIDEFKNKIIQGDCIDILKEIPDNSVDAVVTDPPAGISFMGKEWDTDKGGRDNWIKWMQEIAIECNRVLKPGGHALVWAIPRTSHWTATAWENAGFQIRDVIAHIFGSGFPKSLNIGKAVDKLQGNEREDLGEHPKPASSSGEVMQTGLKNNTRITKGYSEWEGWGTALKPAREDWILMRKPLEKGLTIAENVLKWGTGGINIDGCRIETADKLERVQGNNKDTSTPNAPNNGWISKPQNLGRFPSNLIHDGSDEVVSLFPNSKAGKNKEQKGTGGIWAKGTNLPIGPEYGDSGSASRFFYKAEWTDEEYENLVAITNKEIQTKWNILLD